jgi:uncharacterized caspase-like protein
MRRHWPTAAFLFGILMCLASVVAGSGVKAETRVALIIANAAYEEAPLLNPTVDADLVRPALETMGFDVTVAKDADLETFVLALRKFYSDAKGAEIALFYFPRWQ